MTTDGHTVRSAADLTAPLMWVAAVVAAAVAVVSGVLVSSMDSLYGAAVVEGRAPLSSGEASEFALTPGAGVMWGVVVAALTVLAAWLVSRRLRHGRIGWRGVVLCAAVLVLVATPTLIFVADRATFEEEHYLFGWWYLPFLVAGGASYLVCLVGSSVAASRPTRENVTSTP